MNPPYASASLYVGDLNTDITEGMLFDIFNQVGPVASIRVCRDAMTRRSLGYAYVNYHNVVDAERALDTLNSTPIKARPCRVMWSQRDPSLRKSGVGNIFIKNLHKDIDHKALYDTFSASGNILSCKVVTDEGNRSKGYGFVHFETKEAAEKAISKVNGMMLNDQKVFVGPFVARKERLKSTDGEQKYTNIYVKNIKEGITEDQLKTLFQEYGLITNAAIMADGSTGKSKGFGFVNFETPEAAKKAVEALNNTDTTLNNKEAPNAKPLFVGRAQKKSEREAELRSKFEALKNERLNKYQGVNLYVKNLEDNVDDEKLRTEFAPFGNITSCKVMKADNGTSKGFGFVCYTTPEEATRAVSEMNTKIIGTKPLYVALAQRREVRKAQLEAQHAQRAKQRMNAVPMGYPPAPGVIYSQPGIGGQMYPNPYINVPRANTAWPRQPQPQQAYQGGYPAGPRPSHQGGGGRGGRASNQQGGNNKDTRGGGAGSRRGGGGGRTNPRTDAPAASTDSQAAQQPTAAATNNPPPAPGPEEPLTAALLAQFPEQQKRLIVGEKIFPLVQQLQPELASKITGMLLGSFHYEDMLGFIQNREALESKVNEAVEVLQKYEAAQPNAAQ